MMFCNDIYEGAITSLYYFIFLLLFLHFALLYRFENLFCFYKHILQNGELFINKNRQTEIG